MPQVGGVGDYFYTADEACLPGGPAFSYTFYTTWSAIVQAIFAMVGIALFQTAFKTWRLRHIFWVRPAQLLAMCSSWFVACI